jgi:hypothetical protein
MKYKVPTLKDYKITETKPGIIHGDDEFYRIIPTMQSLINILQTSVSMHKYAVSNSSILKKEKCTQKILFP